MQEIHSMGAGGGRFFSGGGDRRVRPHHHQNNHQALKCPRCDSLNTKFCYYNNYNLSQPRHFCKNCRRYWTKGGVLRNVPVGGGCRKSKRSNNNKPSKNNSSSETTAAPPEHNSNSHSSSESSSLTAANTAANTAATTEAVSAPTLNSDSNNKLLDNMHETKLLIHQNPSSNPGLETGVLKQQEGVAGDSGIFSEIGSFTSLITSTSTNDALAFGFGTSIPDTSSLQWQHPKVMTINADHHHNDGELKLPENLSAGSLLDPCSIPVDLSALQNKTGHGGFGSLDWHGVADQGLFDLSNTVDQAYWTHTHWSDHDNSTLFHLP